ncbi:acyl-CoA thioesterase [Thermocrispum municipale]|uniref:acyl-CoA thioesterase n=1 Tax=Thermocrispum municipale TaxID=37926 RepID=UPI00040348DE|nr:acyl-CoA thioesterase [Thermocrispum municipale]
MSEFVTRIKVRHYELDTLGHVNHAVYHQYGEVARMEWFESIGGSELTLDGAKVAPVLLETRVRFRRELRAGDEIEVTCKPVFGDGKTFRLESEIRKLDGTLSAEIECVLGLMDLERRKLVDKPVQVMREHGFDV